MAGSDKSAVMSYLIVITVAVLCLGVSAQTNPCSSRLAKINAYQACFNKEGLMLDNVFDWYRRQVEPEDMTEVPHEMMFAEHGAMLCRNPMTLRNAIRCSYQLDMTCASPLEREMMINPDHMARAMDYLCANRTDIDFRCLITRHDHVMKCAAEQRDIYIKPGVSFEAIKCFIFKALETCTKREFKFCGCPATKTYSDIAIDLLTPESCSARDKPIKRVVCSEDAEKSFISDGLDNAAGSRLFAYSALPLLAVSCLLSSFSLLL